MNELNEAVRAVLKLWDEGAITHHPSASSAEVRAAFERLMDAWMAMEI